MPLFARPIYLPPPDPAIEEDRLDTELHMIAVRAHWETEAARVVNAGESEPVFARARPMPLKPDGELPTAICWMPAGRHEICASRTSGAIWEGVVIVDERAAQMIIASFAEITSEGVQFWLDRNHDSGEACGWVTGFFWEPEIGIMAGVKWTALGEQMLREKRLVSFSPCFHTDSAGRPSRLHALGNGGALVNAPAFGRAMPTLAAASVPARRGILSDELLALQAQVNALTIDQLFAIGATADEREIVRAELAASGESSTFRALLEDFSRT